MRKYLFLLAFVAGFALAISACDLETTDSDTDSGGTDAQDLPPTDTTTGTNNTQDTGPEPLAYRYARVDDLSDGDTRKSPGADIDAIELRGPSGPKSFATGVIDSDILAGDHDDNEYTNTSEAVGAPNPECYNDQGFVALGGVGGFIVVEFGMETIDSGDTIIVSEIGNCTTPEGQTTHADQINLSVSVSQERTGIWHNLGTSPGGESTFPVGTLPTVYP